MILPTRYRISEEKSREGKPRQGQLGLKAAEDVECLLGHPSLRRFLHEASSPSA